MLVLLKMSTKQKLLIVIIGPTAVGKTSICVDLAAKLNTVVVSADSRQFYKEMSIGTAKPTTVEMKGIQHYFIDNKSISEDYNVGQYESEALASLDEIFKLNSSCILTGGSGLFVDAVCHGIDSMPKIPVSVRDKLNKEYELNGLESLVQELEQSDPAYLEKVDKKNPQRILRALEICRFTGKSFTSFRNKKTKSRPFKIIKIGLQREREHLYDRIELRVDEMIKQGLFDEVAQLKEYKNQNALNTVGYKESIGYLDSDYDKEEAIRLLKRNSRRYAKRQMTWFRRYDDIEWFDADNVNEVEEYITEQMKMIK